MRKSIIFQNAKNFHVYNFETPVVVNLFQATQWRPEAEAFHEIPTTRCIMEGAVGVIPALNYT